MREWISRSPEETRDLGRELALELGADGVLLLSGDLGAGKTVLVQGIAQGLGLDPDEVQSPTYTLIAHYERGAIRLTHVDLYRLDPEETYALGLEEEFYRPGVKVVEWAERLPFPLKRALRLELRRQGSHNERKILETEPNFDSAEEE